MNLMRGNIQRLTFPQIPHVSGRSYLAGPVNGEAGTATNTNLLTTDRVYAISAFLNDRVTISTLGFTTSSTNASVGASVRLGIYSVAANGTPDALLATTGNISITDSATTTTFSGALATNVTLNPGYYFFALISTATTTQAQLRVYASSNPWMPASGASTIANAGSAAPIMGYVGTSVFASGLPATFPTPTAITAPAGSTTNQAPTFLFTVA